MELALLKDLHRQMSSDLKQIGEANTNPQKWAIESICIVQKYLAKVKEHIITHPFKRRSEEIFFFKKIKPEFMGELIFFSEIFNIWRAYPAIANYDREKKFWLEGIKWVQRFFDENEFFCRYLTQDNTWLDAQYFVRRPKNSFYYFGHQKKLDPVAFYGDPDFSTSHDYRTAGVIAFFRLRRYVHEQLKETEKTKGLPPKVREYPKDAFQSFLDQRLSDFRETEAGRTAGTAEALEYLEESIQAELKEPTRLRTPGLQGDGSHSDNPILTAIKKFQAEVAAENKDVEYDNEGKDNPE